MRSLRPPGWPGAPAGRDGPPPSFRPERRGDFGLRQRADRPSPRCAEVIFCAALWLGPFPFRSEFEVGFGKPCENCVVQCQGRQPESGCRRGGTGRRSTFAPCWAHACVGSNPTAGSHCLTRHICIHILGIRCECAAAEAQSGRLRLLFSGGPSRLNCMPRDRDMSAMNPAPAVSRNPGDPTILRRSVPARFLDLLDPGLQSQCRGVIGQASAVTRSPEAARQPRREAPSSSPVDQTVSLVDLRSCPPEQEQFAPSGQRASRGIHAARP